MEKKSLIFYYLLFIVFFLSNCSPRLLHQKPMGDDEEELQKRKKGYIELIHKAAPGVSWREIEAENRKNLLSLKENRLLNQPANLQNESFAGGLVHGTWNERGSNNIAGNVRDMDYWQPTNEMYLVSDGGTLWKANADNGNWVVLNQNNAFNPRIIKVINNNGNKRILTAFNNTIQYSDNEGASFITSSGISFPVGWGGNLILDIKVMNDAANTIYCLTRPWDPTPWAPRFWLYRSVNKGVSFTQIHTFDFGEEDQLSLYSPYNSNELYALDANSATNISTLYSVSGSTVTVLNNSTSMPVNVDCNLAVHKNGSTLTFYALNNNNSLFRSTNNGATWTLQSILPDAAWNEIEVSIDNVNTLYYGGVNCYASYNAGVSWNLVTGGWGSYYGNESIALHADIMDIKSFKKSGGAEFTAVNTHGGYYTSADKLLTVSNKSLSNLNTAQTWDVITDRTNNDVVYIGSQDQGIQKGTGAAASNNTMSFVQFWSGDYGHLVSTDMSPSKLWTEYPGGEFSFYRNPATINIFYGEDLHKTALGSQLPNYGWMLAAASSNNENANEILVGGGNMTGGGGSYLVKFKANTALTAISDSQYNYDFRANSNNASSGISAVEASTISNSIYAATEDGTFFYSSNGGTNWNKASGFTGPSGMWLYGSCILASKINSNVVWFAGSGYSNPAVYKSNNGGANFTAISNGLPATLVHEIVASDDEQLLFAATEAGPYVYVAANNQWYSLMGAATPINDYFSIEYVKAHKTVRYGTYGRGIWDFKIDSATLTNYICAGSSYSYVSNLSGISYQWQVNTGGGFVNINDGATYNGTTAKTLLIKNIPSSYYGYQYRCVVDGNFSTLNTLKLTSYWKGTAGTAWENAANWNCGAIPDANVDVVVNTAAPNLPVVTSINAACRSINVKPGSGITITVGGKLTVTR